MDRLDLTFEAKQEQLEKIRNRIAGFNGIAVSLEELHQAIRTVDINWFKSRGVPIGAPHFPKDEGGAIVLLGELLQWNNFLSNL